MPKSRRDKEIVLTKAKKKDKEFKTQQIDTIRECCTEYTHVYVFHIESIRNDKQKEQREEQKDYRIFMGKNKVMMYALGTTSEQEARTGTHMLCPYLIGNNVGQQFTNDNEETVIKYFSNYEEPNFARTGFCATQEFVLSKGILDVSFSLEPYLRKQGLDVKQSGR